MLSIQTEFPYTGARAFIRHTAEEVRIIQRNANRTVVVGRAGVHPAQRRATDTFRVDAGQLVATEEEARALPKRRRRIG